MNRIGIIVAWIFSGLVSALTLFSAVMGMIPMTDPAALAMTEKLGITGMGVPLGIAKIVLVALYLWPRTSTVGFVLMVGYYGGALATNITHGFTLPEYAPVLVVFLFLTVAAWFRNPELLARLLKKPVAIA